MFCKIMIKHDSKHVGLKESTRHTHTQPENAPARDDIPRGAGATLPVVAALADGYCWGARTGRTV